MRKGYDGEIVLDSLDRAILRYLGVDAPEPIPECELFELIDGVLDKK